ncbi:MAG: ACP S-malonyltransferase [Eubacteriales bacterium]|nr:ACP S-malonyltransferase [Eubacteriales bacterium]
MGKIAFVFAGQGAQYPGMGKALYQTSAAAKAVFDMAERLRPGTLETCFSGTKEELAQTLNTQPCLFAMDLACACAAREAGIEAAGAAGFSLGETAAAAFCGLLPYEAAFAAVCERARLMQACGERHPGGMSAVLGLPTSEVEELCGRFGEVYPVNYNCPGQTVVSACQETLPAFEQAVKAAGGRALRLRVSAGFHSPFMEEAADALEQYLGGLSFCEPEMPLYANLTARPYTAQSGARLLSAQVKKPVLWQQSIENMICDGYDRFVEVGAGKTLCGLIGKISEQVTVARVEDPETLTAALQM